MRRRPMTVTIAPPVRAAVEREAARRLTAGEASRPSLSAVVEDAITMAFLAEAPRARVKRP